MGARSSSSSQRDSRCEDEEPLAGLNVAPEEDSAEERNNGEISSLNGKAENQSNGLSDQCKERILIDDGPAFVIPQTDAPDPAQALQEQEVSQASTENSAQDSTDDLTGDNENVISNKLNKPEVCFKKIFRFGGLQFTLRKNSLDKTDAEEPVKNEQSMKDACPSLDSWDTIEGEPVSINDQYGDDKRGDENAESTETDNKEVIGQITEHSEDITTDKRETEDATQHPEPDGPMSPIKRFVTQGIFGSLRRKKKDKETITDSTEEQRKIIDKDVKGLCAIAQEDSTCACLEFSNITLEEDKDLLTQKRDESKSRAEEMQTGFQKEDGVQASPFKRLFRKLSTRRHKDTKTQTNPTESADNLTKNVPSTPELLKKKEESDIVEQTAAEEDAITRPEGLKKRSDSIVSWESLICGGSLKRIVRKTSDCEEVKGELTRKATESPTGSSTESDYNNLASSNEQIGSHAETDSTWKSFKKLVTPKRKSKMDESGSSEQIPSDTELTTDESFCSIRKLISAHKKKSDLQPENISSEEESKGTGTDNEVDETPVVVPMSEYEVEEPEHLQMMTEQTIESTPRKEVHTMTEEDKQEQTEPSVNPSYDTAAPISSDYFEEVTEFISKYQQLSDIPEEGIIEESVATPVSFVEWTTQDDTLAEDVADMTADAVTAPEHPTEESNGDETTEMVSALSQLTESQKTSGNATPDPSMYDEGKSDLILQRVAETFCMAPSVLSIIINDKDPDTSRTSDFSATNTETKVLEEATAICVGLVSQNMGELRKNLPLPIVEGIFETNEAVPTELVYEEFTDDQVRRDKARIATDKVYVAELKDLKTKFHKTVSRDPTAATAEAMGKSKQEITERDQDKVSHVTHVEERKEVHTTLLSKTQLLGNQVISKSINKPESETSLNPVLERPAHEQAAQSITVTVVGETEHRHTEVESTATNIQGEVAESAANKALASVSDKSEASEITENSDRVIQAYDNVELAHNDALGEAHSTMNRGSESTEDVVQVTLAEGAVLAVQNDAALVTDNTFEKSEITKEAVTQVEDAEGVAHSDGVTVSETRLREVTKSTEDVIRITQDGGALLEATDIVPSLQDSTLMEASKITEDVVHATSQAQEDEVVVTENTLHESLETADHVDPIILDEDVSIPESTLRDASEITEDVVQVRSAEGAEMVTHKYEVVVTENTLHEATENTGHLDQITLVENVELLAHSKLVSVPKSTRDSPELAEDVVQVMLAEGVELVAHNKLISVPESTIIDASEITEDVVQVRSAEGAEMVAHKYEVVVTENTLHEATENTGHDGQITLVENVEFVAHSNVESVPKSTLRGSEMIEDAEANVYIANNVGSSVNDCTSNEASEIAEDVAPVMLIGGVELVGLAKEVVLTETTVQKTSEFTEDAARVTLAENVELVAHSDLVPVPESTLIDASEITEDVFQVRSAEGAEMVAHKYEVVMTENTLHEVTENTGHLDQITLVEDVELVAHSKLVSVPKSTRDSPELAEDVIQVMLAEGVELVAHNKLISVPESTSRDAPEIAEDVAPVMLIGGVELVGHAKEVVLTETTVQKTSEFTEDAARVTLAENVEYVAHSKLVSVPKSTLIDASETIEDVVQVRSAEGVEMEAHKYEVIVTENTLHEVTENTGHLVEDVELVAHSEVESGPKSTLRGVPEMLEDAVQAMPAEGVELVEHTKEVVLTDSTVHEASEITEDAEVENVALVARSDVLSVPESTLRCISEIIEDTDKVTQAEDTVYVANNAVLPITDSTLHEASQIADHTDQVTLVEDSEFVAQSDVVSVPERTLRDTQDVVKVTQAEDTVQVANDIVPSGTDSTFNEVSEIKDDAVQVTLAKDDELIANSDEVSMAHTTLRESSKCNKHIVKVTQTDSDVLGANNTIASLAICALHDASDIKNVFAQDTLTKDAELVAHNNELAVPISTINRAPDNLEDTNQITLVEKVELESHNDVVILPASTLREGADSSADVVNAIRAEIGMDIANSALSGVTDSTLNKASEITDDVEVTLAKDVELVAHSNVVSEFDSALREATEIMLDVNVTQAEGSVLVANNVSSVPDSASNEASEFKDDAQVRLVEDVELVALNVKLSVTDSTLNEGLNNAEDVVNVTRAQYTMLAGQNVVASPPEASEFTEDAVTVAHDLVLLPLSTIIRSSENTDDVTQAEDGVLAVSVADSTFNKPSEITEHNNGVSEGYTDSVFVSDRTLNEASKVTEVTQAGVGMSVGQRVVDLVPGNTLNEASEFTENCIQSIQSKTVKTVTHNVLSSGPISTMNGNAETTDNALDTLAGNNEASATDITINKASEVAGEMTNMFPTDNRKAISAVSSVSDSIQVEVENLLQFVSSHVKENNTEFINGKMNTEPVLYAVKMDKMTTQPKIESMAEEDSRDIAVKKIVQSTVLQNIQETDETSCYEKEAIILDNKCHLHISATCEESREVEEEGISKVTLGHEIETDIMPVPDHTTKPRTGGEIFLIPLKENKPDERSQQTSAIFKEPQLHEELAEEERQPLAVENPKLEQQECYSKLAIDTYTTDEALGFKMGESSMTEEMVYVTLSEDIMELTETAMPVHSDFLSEPQETKQNGSPTNYEPEVENCEKGSLQTNETVSVEAFTCVEDTNQPKLVSCNDNGPDEIKEIFEDKYIACRAKAVESNISEQPVETPHSDKAPVSLPAVTMEVDQGNIKDTAKTGQQNLEGCILPITDECKTVLETVIVGVTQMTGEVLSEQKADVIVGAEQNTEYPHSNTQEMVSKFYSTKTAEMQMNTEMQSTVLKEEMTKDYDERQITRFTEQMTETEMVTETLALTSVPAVLQTVSVKTENDLQETSSPISVLQTEDTIPIAPVPAVCAISTDTLLSGEASVEGDTNANTVTEVELQELNLDMTIATSETMVFTKPNRQTIAVSARETETVVATCQETTTEILDPVGISVKDNIKVGLSGFSTTVTESQLKSAVSVKEPILAQEEAVPEVKERPVNSEIQQLPSVGREVNLTGATQEDPLEVE